MRRKIRANWIRLFCALAAMIAAVAVRLPAARLSGLPEEQREAYRTESGLPYLTDPDSYYHTRITDNFLRYGALSENRAEDGRLWDAQSSYPEGRSAEYHSGIVWMTEAVWKVAGVCFGADLYTVECWLPSVMAALTALAAFFFGKRVAGTAGGFVAGVLVSCASAFVARVLPGRFDTDMFIAVMDVCLMLTMTEALRAKSRKKQVVAAAFFAMAVLLYYLCWTVYAVMFAVLTVAGGGVFLLVRAVMIPRNGGRRDRPENADPPVGKPAWQAWLLCVIFMTGILFLAAGPSFFRVFLNRLSWAGSMTESGTLPNLLVSVTELNRPLIVPDRLTEWFVAYVPGKTLTVLNGIGGAAVAILAIGGMVMLFLRMLRSEEAEDVGMREKMVHLLYFCMFTIWLCGTLFASRQGIRFVEHLAVPVGLLAGLCVGWSVPRKRAGTTGKGSSVLIRSCCTLLLCAAAVAIPLTGAFQISRQNRPSVSDALEEGMVWIREHAEDPDAVIASWWDLGYFYEYASGHPTFWDGGSQAGIRAILIAKALTSRDLLLSERILQMLAGSGNAPVGQLIDVLDEERAFAALWDLLLMERQEAEEYLRRTCGFSRETAEELAERLHPEQDREVYLVISGDMLYKLGWIEYYADWDFAGGGKPPAATVYSMMPDGSADMHAENEEARAFFAARAQETIWKLFFRADGDPYFAPVFETSDGVHQIQIWRVSRAV